MEMLKLFCKGVANCLKKVWNDPQGHVIAWYAIGVAASLVLALLMELYCKSCVTESYMSFLLASVVLFVLFVVRLLRCTLHRHEILQSPEFRFGGFLVLFLLAMLLYAVCPVVSCQQKSIPQNSILCHLLEAPNRALSSFWRSHGGIETLAGGDFAVVLYFMLQILIVVYIAGLVFSYFGVDIFNRFGIHYCKTDPGRTIAIWGFSHKSVLLARNPGKDVRNVVFMLPTSDEFDDDRRKKLIHEIPKLKALDGDVKYHWRFVDYDSIKPEKIVGDKHFFLSESGRFNISLAQKVIDATRTDEGNGMVFYVKVETSTDERYFSEWMERNKGMDIRILKESEIVAESLVKQYPVEMNMPLGLIPGAKPEKQFNVMFIGFGKNGKNVLTKTIENAQCPWRTFHATVVDAKVEGWRVFKRKCREAVKEYDINFVPYTVGTQEFSEFLESALRECRYDRIVVCLGNDGLSLSLCSEIERIQRTTFPKVRETPIYVQMDDPYTVFEQPEKDEKTANQKDVHCLAMAPNIKIFGMLERVYDLHAMENDRYVTVAKWLNYWYNKSCPEGFVPDVGMDADREAQWKIADHWSRSSNYAAALGQANLLRMLGYEVKDERLHVPDDVDRYKEEFLERLYAGNTLEILAECEHLRWNAFHFLRGVRCWDLKHPSLDEVFQHYDACGELKNFRQKQIPLMNRHAALVPFSDLPATDAAFDNFARAKLNSGDRHSCPDDFRGERKKRKRIDKTDGRYTESNVDAMQEDDYKFCRTLYENVRNSGCVLVPLNKEKEG